MSGFTTYFVQKAAGLLLSGVSWTPPTTYYLLLHIGEPTDLGTSNPSVLTTRVSATFSAPDATGTVTLTADLSWSETAPETITHVSGWDASTGGHCCFTKKLESAKNYYSGDTIVIPKFSIQLAPSVDLTELDGAA